MQVSIRIFVPSPSRFDTLSPWYEFLRVKHRHQFIISKKEIVKSLPYFQGYVKRFDPITTPHHFHGSERQNCTTSSSTSSSWSSERLMLNNTSSSFGQRGQRCTQRNIQCYASTTYEFVWSHSLTICTMKIIRTNTVTESGAVLPIPGSFPMFLIPMLPSYSNNSCHLTWKADHISRDGELSALRMMSLFASANAVCLKWHLGTGKLGTKFSYATMVWCLMEQYLLSNKGLCFLL
jgi:hypothetical protein